jgi:molybdopterin molybdotransferase
LELISGRSAAGSPFSGKVPDGTAVRVLTGAQIPEGVDTVILDEDVNKIQNIIYFNPGLKKYANIRPQGEDISAGSIVLQKGKRVCPADLGVLASSGIKTIKVYDQLKVAIMTTGDELVELGNDSHKSQIVDANRPMLIAQIERWGYTVLDFGIVGDNEDLIETVLNKAAKIADIILTTGGASAGDEDHISKLLVQKANLQTWRIALKPGRPLALALWSNTPILGLPGNPVAAMVCAHIFAYPAFSFLAGSGWRKPISYNVPAAFSKNKKPGRTEYLRARLNIDGHAEIFKSEGSGRISGLSWAEGLVALDHNTENVEKGNTVKYIPF